MTKASITKYSNLVGYFLLESKIKPSQAIGATRKINGSPAATNVGTQKELSESKKRTNNPASAARMATNSNWKDLERIMVADSLEDAVQSLKGQDSRLSFL